MLWNYFAVVAAFSLSFAPHQSADAHGYLASPRSRNVYAHEVGPGCSGANCPPAEYCHHCLNLNENVCGKFGSRSYDDPNWVDNNGNPMPWMPQEEYVEGQSIRVRSYLDTHHNGHMEIRACNKGSACTPADFEGNELIFVKDLVYEGNHPAMPKDPNYPYRGMYAGGQGGSIKWFEFEYELPQGIYGDQVLLQWKYITANSCSPPGYSEYFSNNPTLPSSYWTPGLSKCTPPYPNSGDRSSVWPEVFFNCAEVKILPSTPAAPTFSPKPTTARPTGKPTVSSPPTPPPINNPTCMAEWNDCTWTSNCCDGLVCTQVDQYGTKSCLRDTCSDGPTTPTPPTGMPPSPKPTPSPTMGNPTTPTTPTTPTPPTTSNGCCTINLQSCHHEEGTFCALSKENCEGPCGKLWLDDGPLDGCTGLWNPCSQDSDCCMHGYCDAGSCYAGTDPYLKNGSSPTSKPTTAKPTTLPPTSPPTMPQPTQKPTVPAPTNKPTTAAPVTQSPHGPSYPANESEFVRVNQVGYLRFATKVGVIVDLSTSPIGWQIQDASGSVVLSGVTTVYGNDSASGDHVHQADFTALNELGAYRLVANGIGSSFEFNIAPSLYPDLPHEAMNYFYFHRMGEDILAAHLIDGRYARAALHPGDSSVPPYNGWCESCANFDLKGSWADAGDFGIYTVNHAISAWTLLNVHEMFPEAFQDGSLNIPESGNIFADVLDEVDYGSRFVRGMLPSDGGLASHKAHNHAWSAFTITVAGENAAQSSRSAMGPSTPATYAVARVNAQLARIWYAQGQDSHADVLWSAAVDAWTRAYGTNQAYSASVASPGPALGGGDYPDGQIGDDLYAAACEMYLTALAIGDSGVQTYKNIMRSSSFFTKIVQWDWATVTGAGTLSLFAVENDLSSEDKLSIETNIVSFANSVKNSIDSEGYPSNLDFQKFGGNYPWGSNSFIMNRAIALAYAYEVTGDVMYQDYILRTLDYVMGVNAMHISYVTGYGDKSETDTHDRWAWTVGQGSFWPRGWLSGGPNNELINDYATPPGVTAAKSYAGPGTAPHAWGSKENTVNWNAPLAWVAWYVENKIVPNFEGCDGNCASKPTLKPTTKSTTKQSTKPTLNPTTKPTFKPTTKPTSKPVSTGGSPCCADRNAGYQACMRSDWCNMSSTNCSHCNGYFTPVPLEITGCCLWWSGGDCSNVIHSSNPGCHYRKSDCEGSCGGTWSPL